MTYENSSWPVDRREAKAARRLLSSLSSCGPAGDEMMPRAGGAFLGELHFAKQAVLTGRRGVILRIRPTK